MRTIRYNRKTNPKVKGGKVQKKNNHQLTPRRGFTVDRETPRQGYKHLVTKREIFDFIELLPDWPNLINGIECIRLTSGDADWDGQHRHYNREKTGSISLSAWRCDLVQEVETKYFNGLRSIFDRIGLRFEKGKDGVTCWFDEPKAKAFILVHIFMHELGHHLDSMQRKFCASGEPYAEYFAKKLKDEIWMKYVQRFGQP